VGGHEIQQAGAQGFHFGGVGDDGSLLFFLKRRSSFFEKKESKKLCSASRPWGTGRSHIEKSKFFLLLFCSQKRRLFLRYCVHYKA
jgi:hypothetical protein